MGDLPIAVIYSGGGVYPVLSDHLGTPRQIINTAKQLRWRWDNIDPFGANFPNQNPAGLGGFGYNLRFPGQFYDAESGQHYNMFRDYSPGLGRYLESDPIGLEGGLNTYGYVGGNPLKYTDPTGEAIAIPAICLLNPHACITLVVTTCYTVYQVIHEGIPQLIKVWNNSCKGEDCSGDDKKTAPPPPLPKDKDPCQQPNSIYDLVDDVWEVVGTILYKDIPYGAIITPPLRAGSCGSVIQSAMSVTGGAIGDLFNLDYL